MSYRHRMQVKMDRRQQANKEEREDRVMYVEPHLRDYEAAHLAAYSESVQLTYTQGYATYANHRGVIRYRLQALISKTAELQARVHEAVITNGQEEA